ncbi:delta-60 repeat domain-containing protein [Dokdonella sp.]|uniref:delta-60 repeat domain-containing protein n=1 Tax=Dokdonella sp. TaxID=2291710 RepID=UPI00261AB276|nr:delta-60 repeat domain-containing protein [Dokdonella sp.]
MNHAVVKALPRLALLLLLVLLAVPSSAQNVRDGFAPSLDLSARIVLQQADGQLLIAGDFTQVGGVARNQLARLRIDGSLDASFDAALDGAVESLVAQPDGRLLVGGSFAQAGGAGQPSLARLEASGAIDASFRPVLDAPASTLALQADGKVLLGGWFTEVGGQPREYFARLNVDGTLDTTFLAPSFDAPVERIAVQADGKILVGGNFSLVGGAEHLGLVRLDADGSLDATFVPPVTGPVGGIVPQPDGKTVVAGVFLSPTAGLVRLNADGSRDAGFSAAVEGLVSTVHMQADGRLLVTGVFSVAGGALTNYVARLNPDGSLDPTFDPRPNNEVLAVLQQYDGKVVLGGGFTTIRGKAQKYLARLNADGSPDVDFFAGGDPVYPGVVGDIHTVATQPDGKILLGGNMDFIGSTPGGRHTALVRLNADGSVDPSFHVADFSVAGNPPAGTWVKSIAIRPDGKILAGGSFDLVDGEVRTGLALFAADGTLDADFSFEILEDFSGPGMVYGVHQEGAGALLIAGRFHRIDGVRRTGIARLRADGSVDPSFDTSALDNAGLYGATVLPDGRVLTNGWQGVDYVNELRLLDTDGSMDTTFWPLMDARIASFSWQPDGRILVSGEFSRINGASARYFARLLPDGTRDTGFAAAVVNGVMDTFAEQIDGSLLVGGRFSSVDGQARNAIARLDRKGSVDAGYDPNIGTFGSPTGGARVGGLVLQADGKVIAYGEFTGVGGLERTNVTRLSSAQAVVQRLDLVDDGAGIRWLRSGAGAALARVEFEWSADRQSWRPLGAGHAVEGGWGIDGVALPHGRNLWVRALGYPKHTPAYWMSMASESAHESVRLVYLPGTATFRVTPSAGSGGRIDPAVAQVVEQGAAVAFTLTPDAGYRIGAVSGCGGQSSGSTYTTAPVAADCEVVASFVADGGDRIFGDGFELPAR